MNIANQTLGAGLATPTNANTALPTNQVAQAPTVVQPVAPHTSQPNWVERLLPTFGSVAGGVITAPLEALDAVSGIGGTALNIAGASAGGAFGKWLENELTGQGGGNGVLESAIAGGAGQGIGDVVAPGISSVLGLASKGTGSLASKFVQGQVAPGLMTKSLSKDLLDNYGINNVAKSVPTVANAITGSADNAEGALANKAVMDALQSSSAPHTAISDIASAVDKQGNPIGAKSFTQQILDQTHGLNPGDTKAIINNVNLEVSKLPQTIAGSTDNVSAFGFSKAMANRAGDLADQAANASGSAKTSLQAASSVYDQLAKETADRTLSPGGQDISISPEATTTLKNNITQQLGSSEPQAAAQINKDIESLANPDGSISARNLRSVQAKWVVANKGLSASQSMADRYGGMTTADLAKSGLPIAGAIAGGGKGLLAGTTAAITKAPAIDAKVAGGLQGLSKITGKAAASKIIPLLTKSGAIAGANLVAGNDTPAPQPALNGTITQGASMNNQPPTQGTTVSTNPLLAIYNQLMAENQADPNNASTSSILSTLNSIAPKVQKQQLAAPVINNTLQDFQNAGGAQGTGGGLMARLEALIPGTAANTYQKQQATAAATLSQLLGISPQSAMSAMPQLMSTQQTANPQLQTLQSIFGNIGG